MMQMNRREFVRRASVAAAAGAATALGPLAFAGDSRARKPNVVIIFTDDQGYQDVGCFGSPNIKTPNLDRMADEGMKFTGFYVAASVCSPSRAALITGSYPKRTGITRVLFPRDTVGLNAGEHTIAEMFRSRGYATACIGKWHLGHHKKFLPTRHGFDTYFGLPYSNDMQIETLPLIEGEEAIETNPDQSQLTRRYTERAASFIRENKDRPFFLYLPHTMPHVPIFASERFKGKSERGLYGDVIEEIDWSVGEILNTLRANDLAESTLVIFTSDNGPWLGMGKNGGSALPLRGGKSSAFEGGHREPCIMWWPGKIPPGAVCSEMATTMDFLPTTAKLIGAQLPRNRAIDGKDIRDLMFGKPGAKTPYEIFCFYGGDRLRAVRSGPWKLHLGTQGDPKKKQEPTPPRLYNLDRDVREQCDLAAERPDIVERLSAMAKEFDDELTSHARPAGTL
ncbi:MAG TPA: sulfatase [Sumerlaeia bacterium]|nr:sulfatase [Sumerlaeia bacterium]